MANKRVCCTTQHENKTIGHHGRILNSFPQDRLIGKVCDKELRVLHVRGKMRRCVRGNIYRHVKRNRERWRR